MAGYPFMHRINLPVSGSAETTVLLNTPTGGIGSVLHWHPFLKQLFTFGGYALESLRSKSTNPFVDGPSFSAFPETGDIPVIGTNPDNASDSTKYTYKRTGMDYRDGGIWIIGDFEELYWGRVVSGTMVWKRLPTTGPKPPTCSQFALHESGNYILGYTGRNEVFPFDTAPVLRQTHILDLHTLIWRQSVTGAGTPNGEASGHQFLVYDKQREKIVNVARDRGNGYEQVWSFTRAEETLTIPIRVFVALALSQTLGYGAWVYSTPDIGKQSVWLNDMKRKRVVTCGGDTFHLGYSDPNDPHGQAASPETWSYNPVLHSASDSQYGWRMVSPFGRGPGTVTPGRPNDGNAWVHDTKRDRYWILQGQAWGTGGEFSFQSGRHGSLSQSSGKQQNPSALAAVAGSTFFCGLLWLNPDTGEWHGVTNSNIGSPNLVYGTGITDSGNPGVYDPVQDCIYAVEGSGNVVAYRCFLNDNDSLITHSKVTVPLNIGVFGPQSPKLQQPAWDVLGRKCYVLFGVFDNNDAPAGYRFIRFDMDNPSATAENLSLPAGASTPFYDPRGTGGSCQIYFDTRNRVVMWPKKDNPMGITYNMYVYKIATNSWEEYPVTFAAGGMQQPSPPLDPRPVGNQGVYDQTHNCLIIGGSTDNPDFTRGFIYLWRYA